MSIQKLFDAASLAQAAYVENLIPGSSGNVLSQALRDPVAGRDEITAAQADNFSKNHRVIYQDDVKLVDVIAVGRTRIITPAGEAWDSWFDGVGVTADFMVERDQHVGQE
jgi:hypothetical protein